MIKYYIDEEEVEESEFMRALEEDVRERVEADYDDLLDDGYEEVRIGNCAFSASQILKNCDPIAYKLGIDDFVSSEFEDAAHDVNRYGSYDSGRRVYAIRDGEEDE